MDSTLSNTTLSDKLLAAINHDVSLAMEEDIGNGDVTAQLIPVQKSVTATIISRESAVICGIPWVERCFQWMAANTSTSIHIQWHVAEGNHIRPDQVLCSLNGNARAILSAERCALNFLQTLSATATATRRYVDAIADTSAHIFDTRKTLPGLRLAQKYAVTIGGGMNQRLGLYDGILIKENHIAAAGSIEAVLQNAHGLSTKVSIQIEVESLPQLEAAIQAGAGLILLDNFNLQELRDAVKINAGRAVLEASGGIDISNVREIALTGVDRISIGSLTKNISAIDLSMRF